MSKIDEVIAVIHKANQSVERLLKKLDKRKPVNVRFHEKDGKLITDDIKPVYKKEGKDGN